VAQNESSDALYFSRVTLTTLGIGDLTPTTFGLRLRAALESTLRFVLLSAELSSYPVLSRRRALCLEVTHLQRAPACAGLERLTAPPFTGSVLAHLSSHLAQARVDLQQSCHHLVLPRPGRGHHLPSCPARPASPHQGGPAPRAAPGVRLSATLLRVTLELRRVPCTEFPPHARRAHHAGAGGVCAGGRVAFSGQILHLTPLSDSLLAASPVSRQSLQVSLWRYVR